MLPTFKTWGFTLLYLIWIRQWNKWLTKQKVLYLEKTGVFHCHHPLSLLPPRWPNVPKRKSKNGHCSMKSMSGKDLSSPPSLLLLSNKQVRSGQNMFPSRCSVFWCAARFCQHALELITSQQIRLGFDLRPRCQYYDNPLLSLLHFCSPPSEVLLKIN